jgi:tRNA 5-methylaminomethyl-2-thiouridine biosynthesis bifunctional protein
MKRDNEPWRTVTPAALRWDEPDARGNACPYSSTFGDVYYSRDDGLEESRYVFLEGNRLQERLRHHQRGHFCIAETGFGTGLNFLLSWQAWREQPAPRPRLHYISVEKHPLTRADLSRALSAWPALNALTDPLLKNYPGLVPGQHRLLLDGGGVTLDLWWQDVNEVLPDLAGRNEELVDAWYLDGFAPALNESMWQRDIMSAMAVLSRPDATFATFTAAGQVRRDLSAAGFRVERAPGYGRKRECLRGVLQQRPRPAADPVTPWDLPRERQLVPETVLVVGGGLAGCTAAAALARRGLRVHLLERANLAGDGSGNDQGILYTRLSRRHSVLTDFAVQSFCFASRYYQSLFASGLLTRGEDGDLCGSFHQSADAQMLDALSILLRPVPELAQIVDTARANELLGVTQEQGGYWYPGSGWLRPVSVCRELIAADNIEVIEQCGNVSLLREGSRWLALSDGETVAEASCAVIATGTGTTALAGLDWLPLQSIRGQTTQLPNSPTLGGLRTCLCHEGYIAPARQGTHCIGATFDLHDAEWDLRTSGHHRNLAALASAVPSWRTELEALDPERLDGRVGFRCASPDYLPLAGPVPDLDAFLRDYAPLRKNAKQILQTRGAYMPGLYLTTGHGSRGLSSTPLCAELLASQICREPPPISRELSRAVSPARFIIRDLGRNKL